MAVDIFLQIDKLKGESKDDKHPGWIEIEVSGEIIKLKPPNTASDAPPHEAKILQHALSGHQANFKPVMNQLLAKNGSHSDETSGLTNNEGFKITIKKKLDQISTEFMRGAANRKDYGKATLHFCTYKGEQTPYVEYKITDEFRIVSYSTDGVEETCEFKIGQVEINKWGYSFAEQKEL